MLLNVVKKLGSLSCTYSTQSDTAGLMKSWQYSWTCLECPGQFYCRCLLGSIKSAISCCYHKVALTMVVACMQQG